MSGTDDPCCMIYVIVLVYKELFYCSGVIHRCLFIREWVGAAFQEEVIYVNLYVCPLGVVVYKSEGDINQEKNKWCEVVCQ